MGLNLRASSDRHFTDENIKIPLSPAARLSETIILFGGVHQGV